MIIALNEGATTFQFGAICPEQKHGQVPIMRLRNAQEFSYVCVEESLGPCIIRPTPTCLS